MGRAVEPLALEEAIQPPEMKQKHGGRGPHAVGGDQSPLHPALISS
jgi:hypothetical protein